MSDTARPRYASGVPFLAVADVDASVSFYVDRLGFTIDWTWGTPTSDAGLRRDDVAIYLTCEPALASKVASLEVVLNVFDVDAAYADHVERGAPIADPLAAKPWGTREYRIDDPTGYRLRIGEAARPGR